MRKVLVSILAVAVLAGIFFIVKKDKKPEPEIVEKVEVSWPKKEVIGKSVLGRDIEAYTYGKGENLIVLVGGIHGGYEWNSVTLANEFMSYLDKNKGLLPENIFVSIIPNANPDGYEKSKGEEGRFNANGVDLNRNFDCKWQPEATWRSKKVGAGTKAFSEPEALAIKNFVEKYKPDAVVFYHSQANAVYASECHNGILPETLEIMNAYSKSSGYPAVESFSAYPVTGDAEGWLASIGIPAITVELSNHETIEWSKNLAGFRSLLEYYKNKNL